MKKFKNIRYSLSNNIAYISIQRPRGNKINAATLKELYSLLKGISDLNLNGVIFHSPADFSSGADLRELAGLSYNTAKEYARLGQETFFLLNKMDAPSLAAVNGFALGPGFELALACDIRIASNTAIFSHPARSVGLSPCFGGSIRLAQIVGKSQADSIIKSSRRISAQEAHQLGIIDYLVDKKNLLFEAERILRSEEAVKTIYRDDDFHEEREAFARCFMDPTVKSKIRKKI